MATRKTTKKNAEEKPAEIIEVKKETQPKKVTRRKPVRNVKEKQPEKEQKPVVEVVVQKPLPLPNITIHNIIELQQAPLRAIVLNDQQIQMLTMEEIVKRHRFLQETLTNVLDYDVVRHLHDSPKKNIFVTLAIANEIIAYYNPVSNR